MQVSGEMTVIGVGSLLALQITAVLAQLLGRDDAGELNLGLACLPHYMLVTLNTTQPFYGKISSLYDSTCFTHGVGERTTQLLLPLDECGMYNETLFYRNQIQAQRRPNEVDDLRDPVKTLTCHYALPIPPYIPAKPEEGKFVAPAAIVTGGLSDRDILLLVCILAFLIMLTCCCGCAYYCMRKRGVKLIRAKPSPPTSYAASDITAVTSAGRITLVGVDVRSSRHELSRESALGRYSMSELVSTSGYHLYEPSSSEGYSSGQWMDDAESVGSPVPARFDAGPLSLPRPAVYARQPVVDGDTDVLTRDTMTTTTTMRRREVIETHENHAFEADDERESGSASPPSPPGGYASPPSLPSPPSPLGGYDPASADTYVGERPDAFVNTIVERTQTTTVTEEMTQETTNIYHEEKTPPRQEREKEEEDVEEEEEQEGPEAAPSLSASMRNDAAPTSVFVKAPSGDADEANQSWHLALVDIESQVSTERGAAAVSPPAAAVAPPAAAVAPAMATRISIASQAPADDAVARRFEFDPGSPPWGSDLRSPDPSRKLRRQQELCNADIANDPTKYHFTKRWLEWSSQDDLTGDANANGASADSQNYARLAGGDERDLYRVYKGQRSLTPDTNGHGDEPRSISEALVLRDVAEHSSCCTCHDARAADAADDPDDDETRQHVCGAPERPPRFAKNEQARACSTRGQRYRSRSSYAGSMRSSDPGGREDDEMRSLPEIHVTDTLAYYPEPDYDI
ncbi:PREDICTED: uncharacterized protein LOC106804821 [Priapulus caudatus]|uniref:Uncharacterized protein LOC106804821 n=1 Tax=Priapulus caudatus TaxID=37621 RepID=A0ABM1DNY5_PRICU|nr:PREDICTED: uncharacterized protein LOC106804821 [Priapulus caudatus]